MQSRPSIKLSRRNPDKGGRTLIGDWLPTFT